MDYLAQPAIRNYGIVSDNMAQVRAVLDCVQVNSKLHFQCNRSSLNCMVVVKWQLVKGGAPWPMFEVLDQISVCCQGLSFNCTGETHYRVATQIADFFNQGGCISRVFVF